MGTRKEILSRRPPKREPDGNKGGMGSLLFAIFFEIWWRVGVAFYLIPAFFAPVGLAFLFIWAVRLFFGERFFADNLWPVLISSAVLSLTLFVVGIKVGTKLCKKYGIPGYSAIFDYVFSVPMRLYEGFSGETGNQGSGERQMDSQKEKTE